VKIRVLITTLSLIALCLGSAGVGYALHRPKHTSGTNQYPLLAKRLFIENPNDPIVNFSSLRESIEDYYATNNLDGTIYFEYLPTGTSINAGADENLVAASLMKTPVVMELYKASELGLINMDKKVTLQAGWLDNAYGTLYQKGVGYRLSLREAARLTLRDSDNTAVNAIIDSTKNLLSEDETSLNSLDVSYTRDQDKVLRLNARSYSSFIKCLYFSCYLNSSDSQQILEELSEATAQTRLRAGVPGSVKIAHKIGTHGNTNQSDCGIIYEPNRNYLLCIMIKGPENTVSDKNISTLSKMVYDYVHNTN
jgi:beta-lactamase class A